MTKGYTRRARVQEQRSQEYRRDNAAWLESSIRLLQRVADLEKFIREHTRFLPHQSADGILKEHISTRLAPTCPKCGETMDFELEAPVTGCMVMRVGCTCGFNNTREWSNMKETPYKPIGLEFYDHNSSRMMILTPDNADDFPGWIHWKHPDGQWVTLRKATDEDRKHIADCVARDATTKSLERYDGS